MHLLQYIVVRYDVVVLYGTSLVLTCDCIKDLAVNVPTFTVVPVLVPTYDCTHYYCNLEQNESQTLRPSSKSSSMCVMSEHDITCFN